MSDNQVPDQPGWGSPVPPTPQSPAPYPGADTPVTGWGQTPPAGFLPPPPGSAMPPQAWNNPMGAPYGVQPGWATAAMPQSPKKTRWWLIVLATLIGLFFTLIVGAVIWVAISASREETPSREVADSFMTAVQDEEYADAATLTCKNGQIAKTARALETQLKSTFSGDAVTGYTYSEFEWDARGTVNNVTGIVQVDGSFNTVIIGVDKIDDTWCVYSLDRRRSVLP